MSNLMHGTLNVIPSMTKEYPAKNIPVFLNVTSRYPGGGVIKAEANTLIPAGTAVSITGFGGTVKALKSSEAESSTPIGLLENDVYSDVACDAQVDIVTSGQVLEKRLTDDAKAFKTKLPLIQFINED